MNEDIDSFSETVSPFFSTFEDSETSGYSSLEFFEISQSENVSQTEEVETQDENVSQNCISDDEETEPIEVPPFFNISPRLMPESPHCVIEEEFKSNPWAMLIATIFLTKTTGKAARPHMRKFFANYPTPYHILDEDPANLETYFDTLGMRKRAGMIWKMSHQFVSSKWRRASDLHGIGKYGEDAYRLFCLGHTDLVPSDRYLRLYLDWYRSQPDEFSIEDSETLIEDPVHHYYSVTLR